MEEYIHRRWFIFGVVCTGLTGLLCGLLIGFGYGCTRGKDAFVSGSAVRVDIVRDTVRITEPSAADSVVTGMIRVPVALPTEPTVPKVEIEGCEPGRLSEVMDGHTGNKGGTEAQETGKIARKDTVWAVVPRTQKRYVDSTYMAWISGYEPRLDSIEVYQKTTVVTKSVEGRGKSKRFSVGLTGGFGYGVFTRKPDVWVGVGCTWRIF